MWISRFVIGGGGAWLMVVDEGFIICGGEAGFDVTGFEEQKRKGTRVATIFFCVASVCGSIILAKSEVKN